MNDPRVVAIALATSAFCAHGQQAYEVSEDGHLGVFVDLSAQDDQGHALRDTVPFPLTSDWQLDLRRQIGGLKIADMNGDGLNDLVAVCYSSNSFPAYTDWRDMILYNTGTELEATPSWISDEQTHTGDVQIGDVNNDTFLDVVLIHGGGVRADAVEIHFGSATGPSTAVGYSSTIAGGAWGTSGLLIDLDKDNDLDLVTTNQGLGQSDPFRPMMQFENVGGALGTTPVWVSAESSIQNGLSAGDVDGDTWTDVGVSKWANWESAIYRNNNGTLETTPLWERGETDTDKGSAIADIDGDGTLDFVIGGGNTTQWDGDGTGTVFTNDWTANPPFSGPQEILAADVDGDGDDDVIEVHFSDGRSHIYLNVSGNLETDPSWSFDASPLGTSLAMGDINGDGLDDLAVGYSGDPCVRVFYQIPASCPADIDGDGDADADDIAAFVDNFVDAIDGNADIDNDGDEDSDDINAFVVAFIAGC